jgi:hypothetical protein
MTYQQYRENRISEDKQRIIDMANAIIGDYSQALTVRQIYYQFIGRDLFPGSWVDEAYNRREGLPLDTKNTVKNYKKLADILVDARYNGLVDWDSIEDLGRQPKIWADFPSIVDSLDEALDQFRLDRWEGQDNYVEVWSEKQALESVIVPVCMRWHVPYMSNKGYSSASALRAAAERLNEQGRDRHREAHVLYVGDFDPSGEDMPRDIADRLLEFEAENVNVDKIALTQPQIARHKLPTNPAKITDPRAARFIARHGRHSWEIDALPPKEPAKLVEAAILALLDKSMMNAVIKEEDRQREKFTAHLKKLKL